MKLRWFLGILGFLGVLGYILHEPVLYIFFLFFLNFLEPYIDPFLARLRPPFKYTIGKENKTGIRKSQ
jgi:hypothetical protein